MASSSLAKKDKKENPLDDLLKKVNSVKDDAVQIANYFLNKGEKNEDSVEVVGKLMNYVSTVKEHLKDTKAAQYLEPENLIKLTKEAEGYYNMAEKFMNQYNMSVSDLIDKFMPRDEL